MLGVAPVEDVLAGQLAQVRDAIRIRQEEEPFEVRQGHVAADYLPQKLWHLAQGRFVPRQGGPMVSAISIRKR